MKNIKLLQANYEKAILRSFFNRIFSLEDDYQKYFNPLAESILAVLINAERYGWKIKYAQLKKLEPLDIKIRYIICFDAPMENGLPDFWRHELYFAFEVIPSLSKCDIIYIYISVGENKSRQKEELRKSNITDMINTFFLEANGFKKENIRRAEESILHTFKEEL